MSLLSPTHLWPFDQIYFLIDLNYKKFQLNKSALIDFFISDFVYDGKTFFEDISYLKAGYYFKIRNNKKYHIEKFTKIKKSSVIYKNFLSEKDKASIEN